MSGWKVSLLVLLRYGWLEYWVVVDHVSGHHGGVGLGGVAGRGVGLVGVAGVD